MNTKQKIALGAVLSATALAGFYGVSTASAATTANADFPPMVQKIVEKYNLNKDEVKAIVDQDRTERQAEREKAMTDRLTQSVTDGKITEAQKTAILAKHEEIQAKREGYRTLSQSERKAKMNELRTEMQTFLKAQGIDDSVMPAPQGPRGEGMGKGMHRGQK